MEHNLSTAALLRDTGFALLTWRYQGTRGTRGQGPKLETYEPANVSRAFLWWGWGGRPWVRVESSGDMGVEVKVARSSSIFVIPWTVSSMHFSRPEYWSGWTFTSLGDLPTQGSNSGLPHCRQILYQLSHSLPEVSHRWGLPQALLLVAQIFLLNLAHDPMIH